MSMASGYSNKFKMIHPFFKKKKTNLQIQINSTTNTTTDKLLVTKARNQASLISYMTKNRCILKPKHDMSI